MDRQLDWNAFFEQSDRQREARRKLIDDLPDNLASDRVKRLLHALDELMQIDPGAERRPDGSVWISAPMSTVLWKLGVKSRNTARTYIDKVANSSAVTEECFVNRKLDPNSLDPNITFLPCYKLFLNEIGQRVDAKFPGNKLLEPQSAAAGGSLGPQLDATGTIQPMEGVFVVEMTDPAESTPTPGSAVGGNNPANTFRDVQLTFTAFAQVRPFDATPDDPWCASNSLSTSASVTSLRAHVTLRNVPR